MPEEFYSAIMLAFGIRVSGHEDEVENDSEDEEEDEWVTETLSWWNGCVFILLHALILILALGRYLVPSQLPQHPLQSLDQPSRNYL